MRLTNHSLSDTVLEMKSASLDFGNGAGVFDLDFNLSEGTILGLIGPSGCSQASTHPRTVKCSSSEKKPSLFEKADKARIGYIPQQLILYPHLSAEENLHFLGGIYGMGPSEIRTRIETLLDFVELREARRRLVRQLSGGMKRRIMLAGALLHQPRLIFADEPTAGIDPILRARIWENFRQLRDEGNTLLVTTQYVGEATNCDQVAVMRSGGIIAIDTPQSLQRRAMGGEIIRLQVERKVIFQVMQYLDNLAQVKKVEPVEDRKDEIYVFVADAGQEIPKLLTALQEELGTIPKKAEPYLPPFDEVFVRLIQRSEER